MKKIQLLALAALLSGCTLSPLAVSPHPRVSADTATMAVTDARSLPPTPKRLRPRPDPATHLGDVWVLANGQTVSGLVASVVATRFPDAKMALREFDLHNTTGLWMGAGHVVVLADIETGDGRKLTVTGRAQNVQMAPSIRNIEIVVEKALEDFAKNLADAAQNGNEVAAR